MNQSIYDEWQSFRSKQAENHQADDVKQMPKWEVLKEFLQSEIERSTTNQTSNQPSTSQAATTSTTNTWQQRATFSKKTQHRASLWCKLCNGILPVYQSSVLLQQKLKYQNDNNLCIRCLHTNHDGKCTDARSEECCSSVNASTIAVTIEIYSCQ